LAFTLVLRVPQHDNRTFSLHKLIFYLKTTEWPLRLCFECLSITAASYTHFQCLPLISNHQSQTTNSHILPLNDLKKVIAVSVANGDDLVAYPDATAFDAVDFVKGYDVGFMYTYKMPFG
jgi:hypothetical protein